MSHYRASFHNTFIGFLAIAGIVTAAMIAAPSTADASDSAPNLSEGIPAPVITIRAITATFDGDGDFTGTPIDTVEIMIGEVVRWQRLVGTHTVTSGTGAADPSAGNLFDAPLDSANPIFDYQFNTAGLYPFFCRPHEVEQMFGAVRVIDPATPTRSTTWGEVKARNR